MLVTVGLEDYYHVGAFDGVIREGRWDGFERRIEANTLRTLELLDRFGVSATFFVMGLVAEEAPELVAEVVRRGHEVAGQGYYHRTIDKMPSRAAFRDDLRRSRDAVERAAGRRVVGHRVPHFLTKRSLWALDVLAEEGYAYDSSIRPIGRSFADRRYIHSHGSLVEVPVSTWVLGRLAVPVAAGNGLRQLPPALTREAVERWFATCDAPFVTYFHVWELDPEQPRINAPDRLTRIRHYRNLDQMEERVAWFLGRYECMGVAEHLGLCPVPLVRAAEEGCRVEPGALPSETRVPISIVVPCYNESQTLPFLRNNLAKVRRELGCSYDLRFIFVDDGSSDDTVFRLEDMFQGEPGHEILRHESNQGVAGAIMTGIRAARDEIVCSIDCDCTYDPAELREMIPRLEPGVAMVTASPYHPDGDVVGVPEWRLLLSRGASWLYRRVLDAELSTYTSCFRVYRRSLVAPVELVETGFLGVAELLGRLVLAGHRIVEHPATLESRFFGQSKMKTLRTIAGHLGLLGRFAARRAASASPLLCGRGAERSDENERTGRDPAETNCAGAALPGGCDTREEAIHR